jgi:hypothetical protein
VPGRVRLSSDGSAKIARYALLPVSGWKAISRYPTTPSSQRRRLGGVPCSEVGAMASTGRHRRQPHRRPSQQRHEHAYRLHRRSGDMPGQRHCDCGIRGLISGYSIKPKTFEAKLADIINLVDAIFDGNQEMPGWVFMAANAKGRECINALFPQEHIAWRAADPALPQDWRGFTINVPDVVSNTETKLPITKGVDLDESSPEALSLLLAMGVKHQGGNAACVNNGKMEIIKARSN